MLPVLLALIQPIACHAVKSEWITGRDLALVVPALAALPPDSQLGLAPAPGGHRVFGISELKRIASLHHIQADISEATCFAWETAVPDRKRVLSAMEKTLDSRSPKIEILDQSLIGAPEGEIVFPLTGLVAGSDKPVIWRGFVLYGEKHQFPIWARVLVTVKEQHLVTTADLHCDDLIRSDQLKMESYEGPVRREKFLLDASQVEGMLVRRPVASGSTLTDDMLDPPREVQRGEVVTAVVETGAARLEVQGVAENDGRRGQIISVKNQRSGRSFQARVEEKGTVTVVPGGQFGLVVETKKS